MRKIDWFLVFLIVVFALAAGIMLFEPELGETFSTLKATLDMGLPLLAAVTSFIVIKKRGISGLQGAAILFLGMGFLCWLVADILWLIYVNVVVSPADIFYFLGYAFLFVAIIYGVRISTPDIFKNKKRGTALLFIIAFAIVIYFYFFPFSWDAELPFLENLLTSGYVVADLLLLIPLIFLCYSLLAGRLSRGWILVAAGVFLSLVGDLWYARNYELYEAGYQVIDLAWYSGYLLWAYAMAHFKRAHDEISQYIAPVAKKKS